jgi:NAD(P)-dependent dehydrogenase (short-subunit alcohol dehydrogenase family)
MENERPVALVTGGSRGIGLSIAEHLAAAGHDVAINGRRAEAEVADAIERLRSHGVEVLYCRADVADADGRAAMLDRVRETFGRLDVLVNNAGVAPSVRADLLEADEDSFDRLININLKGPYFLTQAAANWMVEQKRADPQRRPAIINIGSISATVVSVNRGDYCLSKAGMAMATQLFAARLTELGIGVFEVRPGIIETDMTAGVKEKYDKLLTESELVVDKRWGQPEDIGRAVAMLARGDLTYAPGQVLHVDGGLTMVRL